MQRYLKILGRILRASVKNPRIFARTTSALPYICNSYHFSSRYTDASNRTNESIPISRESAPQRLNPLWEYFQNHKQGHGIWKWEHYFEVYHRHLAKFVEQKVNILEVGIYSGGSLEMWRSYFGDRSHVYGVDIEEICKAYQNDYITVFIGDQADRVFWRNFKEKVEYVDIVIDDGGHAPEQQQITLEELLPHIRPGGVYICEDVHGYFNGFSAFATGLVHELNRINIVSDSSLLQSSVSRFQSSIHSVHFYPYLVVIEKRDRAAASFSAPKHGTEWQPYL